MPCKEIAKYSKQASKKKRCQKKTEKSYVPLLKSHVQTYSKQNVTYFQQHHWNGTSSGIPPAISFMTLVSSCERCVGWNWYWDI
jgi:hypothetical protein